MRNRTLFAVVATVLATLLIAPGAWGQEGDDGNEGHDRRFALALGAGVVEPDNEGEIYYSGALRIRLFKDNDRRRGEDDWRYAGRGDIEAYIEPEIGYWERDERGVSESDLNIGLNAIGVIPGQAVDYFFGVGLGFHFLDTQIDVADPTVPDIDESDEVLGGNFQVGLDIRVGRAASIFGVGRFDVLEGVDDTLQSKVYMGMRFRF